MRLRFRQPFREDAMPVLALLERGFGCPGETIASVGMVAALLAALAWVFVRAPRT